MLRKYLCRYIIRMCSNREYDDVKYGHLMQKEANNQ